MGFSLSGLFRRRGDRATTRCCGRVVTGNAKALIVFISLFLAIAILDRYLEVCQLKSRRFLQLVGLSALLI